MVPVPYWIWDKFFIGSDIRYRDLYEDAAPVVWGSYAFVTCLDPLCPWTVELTIDNTLDDVLELCSRHWEEKHQGRL
jgi:hypothetical protein